MCSDLQINKKNSHEYEIIARSKWKNSFARLRIVADYAGGKMKILQWEEF